eukprot:TRINITY_DN20556_c0_g1_i1.p1 TRINITY_DN20556_c0_g1~~TRINITY_DN20556_c0_g1_i1.p1  ORF type:complete len:264 (-),score=59.00 TRINITY_DN20556_c0_g1_i1:26-817(-)
MPSKRSRQPDTPASDDGKNSADRVSRRRKDAAAFAARVQKAVATMQNGRKLSDLSEHTRAVTVQAMRNAIPPALRSLPSHRQKAGSMLLREISSNINGALEALESPVTWCVGKDYLAASAENRRIEDSLLKNESHRLELQQAITRLEKELESEQQALDECKASTKDLKKKARASDLHPLLKRPTKQTVCHLDLDLETSSELVKPLYSERAEELRAAAAGHLAGIESNTTDRLKYLESVISLKERLAVVLMLSLIHISEPTRPY